MKKNIVIILLLVIIVFLLFDTSVADTNNGDTDANNRDMEITMSQPQVKINYTPLSVPNINSYFKTWMSYKAVTNSYIHTDG